MHVIPNAMRSYLIRLSVHSRRAAEDDFIYAVLLHSLEQIDSSCNVILIVQQRLGNGLA